MILCGPRFSGFRALGGFRGLGGLRSFGGFPASGPRAAGPVVAVTNAPMDAVIRAVPEEADAKAVPA